MPTRDLIYDVGMHRGEDTALYLALGYRVVAFEADPEHCALGRARFAEEIVAGRVEIVEGAIAPGDGTVTFFKHENKSDWGTINADWVARNDARGASIPMTVQVIDLERKIAETGVPYYAKIDIEGADLHCLETFGRFAGRPAYVSIESDTSDRRELKRGLDVLESLGYARFSLVPQARIGGSTLSTRSIDGERVSVMLEPSSSGAFGNDLSRWEDRASVLRRYRRIAALSRVFGEDALIRRPRLGDHFLGAIETRVSLPGVGWYDTHARHYLA